MSFRKFTSNDLYVNFLRTNPSYKFDIYNSEIYYNNKSLQTGQFADNVGNVPVGHINLYEMNIDRSSDGTGLIFPFINKNSSLTTFKTVSTADFYSLDYGSTISGSAYPLSASIVREFFDDDHYNTMRTNNETIIQNEKDDHLSTNIQLQNGDLTDSGFPDFSTSDPVTSTADGVTRNSLQRYTRLKTLLSSSHVHSLKNIINSKRMLSPHFQYSASFSSGYERDLDVVPVNLISIPSIFFGSEVERGTFELNYYLTGTLIGQLKDENNNGELIQVGPVGSEGSGSVAGIALYKEGFVILTGSWDLAGTDGQLNYKNTGTAVTSSWLYFGVGANDGIPTDGEGIDTRASASFAMHFSGTTEVPVMTMLAHAPKGQFNYSNNPTYLSRSTATDYYSSLTSSIFYKEPELSTVNIVSSSFETPTASFGKETYISKIGIYDKDKNLIAVTTVAKPVKKTEDREFTFKVKLDI